MNTGFTFFQRQPVTALGLMTALCVSGLLPGCSIPLPQAEADPTRYYVLSASTVPAAGAVATPGPTIHLRQVELANYVRVRPLIVRRGDNEIQFREFARWGEPLELGIGRVLREELLARGAAGAVLSPGLRAANVNYDFELIVRVLACEGEAGGAVKFRAVWELAGAVAPNTIVARGDFHGPAANWDGKSEASLAARLSEAVVALAAEIAGALPKKG